MNRKLRYQTVWVAMGWLLVMAIFAVSLYPNPPKNLLAEGWAKVWHAFSYMMLMFWFSLVYVNLTTRIKIALSCVMMWLLIEVLQGFSIIRTFDLYDALANAIGVMLGAALIGTRLSQILIGYENLIMGKKNARI